MSWIQTFSGKQFFPLNPKADDICIEDIAHALSNLCRFGGHTRNFYSIAQHSVLVSSILPDEHQLWGLLHDASEAYLCDVVSPVKKLLPDYQDAELGLLRVIAKRFGLRWPMPKAIHLADLVALNTEKRDLLGTSPAPWASDDLAEPAKERIQRPWHPPLAEELFLDRFAWLMQRKAA